ncbi:MAG: histidine--tRNA ligase [Gemmatimonadota bacterium]|nr:histidine--tRNA ligase [Gemmatimonadota bacterium]
MKGRPPDDVQSLPGFREFYPEEFALRWHIFSAWRRVAARYGFVEYDAPPLEPLELYTRKSGDEIVGQLYDFVDKGGRAVALRPEMTPSFARMISARAGALPKPIRWYSIPQLFRYERPQRGRLREHFQLNMDIVGETDPLADAEIIAAGLDTLRELGLDETHVVARVSDRRLVAAVLAANGIPPEAHGAVYAVLDKADRETPEWLRDRLAGAGVDGEIAERVLSLPEQSLEEIRSAYADHEAVLEGADGTAAVLGHLESAGFGPFVRFDAGLVRGLAYYTGTVFEIWERSGNLRAVCGGGRYDDLLASLGGADLPALGFGMGDVVLGELLRDLDLVPGATLEVDDFIVCVSEDVRGTVLELGAALRGAGRRVVYDLKPRGVGRQFKAADQLGAARAVVVGPDEVGRGVAVVRDMRSGEESQVPLAELMRGGAG